MAPPGERRHDLDWLRIGATFLLFPFHVVKTFDVLPIYHIKNGELSPELDYFSFFIHQWHMPLFFVLAGWSAHASIAGRGVAGFRRERVRRLFVPFLLVSLLLCPLLKYAELACGIAVTARGVETGQPFHESFLEFLPTFYTDMDRFSWSHLWFLLYLFTFSLLYTRPFARLLADPERLGRPSVVRLYLPLVPFVLIQTTIRFVWPGLQNLYNDWANFSYYSLFFILGFVLARTPAWEDVIAREWKRAGAIGLGAATLAMTGWALRGGIGFPYPMTLASIVPVVPLQALSGIAGYCTLIGILGFARRHLTWTSRTHAYLNEASLPVYILHQFGIVLPGFFIIQLDASIATKVVLLLPIAVASTMLVYHVVVRPVPALRSMLGMRSRRPERTLKAAARAA
jgi:fucose 4-O-acetylase-like acetyltransferase